MITLLIFSSKKSIFVFWLNDFLLVMEWYEMATFLDKGEEGVGGVKEMHTKVLKV